MFISRWTRRFTMLLAVMAATSVAAQAQDGATAEQAVFVANNLWMMVATFLVFIMHLGFACLESGLVQAKNTVNILFKNIMIVSIGLLTYAAVGFNLMYPGEFNIIGAMGGVLGFAGAGITNTPIADGNLIGYADGGYTYWTDFLFQGMFAATGATIVSGAVAGRIKLPSFLVFTIVFVGLIYPWVGSWKWGGGWLDQLGFYDFAGSTLVHSVGGWGSLAGVLLLGPRIGKYVGDEVRALPGSNMPLATIGVFMLWLGWFGFNGGSVLSADPLLTSFVLVTTCLAASAGVVGAYITSSIVQKKPDLSMALNGALAGLVGITAGADVVSIMSAVIIGLVAGVLVVLAVITIDTKLKLDDPVGAISVHLVCGIWGTLAVGIFSADHSIVAQLTGIVSYGVVTFSAALIIFGVIKAVMGIRVSEEEELKGLDIGEHGMEAYPGFQKFIVQ
jgi:Amt family ammonium transporter